MRFAAMLAAGRIIFTFLFTVTTLTFSFGQKGTVIHERFLAPSIVGNPAGEDAMRRLKWTANFATNMIASHLTALRSLKGIKIDWGRNDAGKHVPVTCLEFS